MIQIELPGEPPTVTSQMKRVQVIAGKPRFFPHARYQAAEKKILTQLAPHRPDEPFEEPVHVIVRLSFPYRKSEPKKNRVPGGIPHTSRPDVDNLSKIWLDCLVKAGFLRDDSLVWSFWIAKRWTATPGVEITIETLQEQMAELDVLSETFMNLGA